MFRQVASMTTLSKQLQALRGDRSQVPDGSIVIPVNAEADLETVLALLSDIAAYSGKNTIEVILVINNYLPEQPPEEYIERYREMGISVIATPNLRKPDERVAITARVLGTRIALSPTAVHFDADVRIPNPAPLLDWYIEQIRSGAKAAYTHVGYFDLSDELAVQFRLLVHVVTRWFKRTVLRLPTIRGSNYAVERTTFLQLYDEGSLVDELHFGPMFKARTGRVSYSGASDRVVLTSGRYWRGGWLHALQYFRYRLNLNVRHLPIRHRSRDRGTPQSSNQ